MNTRTYRTIIQKDDKGYHGFVPALPGCHTYGKSIEETQENLKEAMEGCLRVHSDLGWQMPEDNLIETLQTITLPTSSSKQSYA